MTEAELASDMLPFLSKDETMEIYKTYAILIKKCRCKIFKLGSLCLFVVDHLDSFYLTFEFIACTYKYTCAITQEGKRGLVSLWLYEGNNKLRD
jgi:hypothetical protein